MKGVSTMRTAEPTPQQILVDHHPAWQVIEIDSKIIGCSCERVFKSYEQHAAHVLAELAAVGQMIVKLPEGIPDDDGQVWFDDGDIRVDCTGRAGRTVHVKGKEVSPAQLWEESLEGLAAALCGRGGDQS